MLVFIGLLKSQLRFDRLIRLESCTIFAQPRERSVALSLAQTDAENIDSESKLVDQDLTFEIVTPEKSFIVVVSNLILKISL